MAILESSCARLEEAFRWAENMARAYVTTGKRGPLNDGRTGEGDYIPSYWAGYRTRTAFYIRDYVHQTTGAFFLGLHEENYRMLEAFVRSATEARGLYSLWALNFDGSPYDIDYKGDTNFIREIPAQFELVELVYRLYSRTGDVRYLSDEMFGFCLRSMTDFVTSRDKNGNGVPEGLGGDIFGETCTYNEGPRFEPIEAGDEIACQHRAMLSLAGLMRARGDLDGAEKWETKAAALRKYFNEDWSVHPDDPEGPYVSVLMTDGITKINEFGLETSWFMPLKTLPYPGPRCERFLDHITEKLGYGIGFPTAAVNIEAYTYLPEVFFNYDRVEEGWKWMKYLQDQRNVHHVGPSQGNNGYYPEVSFTMIGHIIEGLMGIVQDVPSGTVSTFSRLPAEVETLTLRNQAMVECEISVKHTGRRETEFENHGGKPVMWQAQFVGIHDSVTVNGEVRKAETVYRSGVPVSHVTVSVPAGARFHACVV
ncbi:MAG: hypothetical protein IJO81_00265 [Clostridia bacterium]|nr:hypothetical protein [Clostridia bacterium]